MRVTDVMTPGVENVVASANLVRAATLMNDLDVGTLAVVDERNVLQGLLTDRDIVVRAIAKGCAPAETRVEVAMSRGVITCSPEATVQQAAELMEEQQIRRLIVSDGENALGVVTLGDLAVKSGDQGLAGEVVEEVSEPAEPER